MRRTIFMQQVAIENDKDKRPNFTVIAQLKMNATKRIASSQTFIPQAANSSTAPADVSKIQCKL